MRVFISEYFCSGAVGTGEAGLLRDGLAMWRAVVEDALALPGVHVLTTLAPRIGREIGAAFRDAAVAIHQPTGPDEERSLFAELAGRCEATLVIAPETGGILGRRRRLVDAVGGRCPGCSTGAIELCADKLRLAEHLRQNGLPVIETAPFVPESSARVHPGPIVVKPRSGAGSERTFLASNDMELDGIRRFFRTAPEESLIQQPFRPGRTCSMGVIVGQDAQRVALLPVGDQQLAFDSGPLSPLRETAIHASQPLARATRFRYRGGTIPSELPADVRGAVRDTVQKACRCLPGLRGYVGFDMIVPEASPDEPVIVEINPRLTTAYIGYRVLALGNLAERMLFPDRAFPELAWRHTPTTFTPDGELIPPSPSEASQRGAQPHR